MGLVFIILGVLLIGAVIFWGVNGFDSDYSMFPIAVLICIVIFGFGTYVAMGPTATKEVRLRTEATYTRLNQIIEKRMEIDADLLKEIYAYNTEIETKIIQQKSLIHWGLFPAIYDEFELIDLEKLEKSISDVDSSIKVEVE